MNVGDLGSTTFAAGNGNDTFSGNWTIDGGAKVISLRNGTHAWGRGTITLDNGTMSQTQGNWSFSNTITVAAGGGTIFSDSSGNNRYMNLSGVISGSGALSFGAIAAMTGQEGFILTGANTFTGPMTIGANGTVRIGGDATTATNSTAAGTLGSIAASVAITNNGILGFGRTDAWTFANTITGTGIVRLGRTGGVLPATQVVTLSAANTYIGATQVNAGRLNLTGSLTSAITVASGASISGTGSTTGLLTLSSGGALVLSGGATYGGLTVNGATFGGSNLVSFLNDPEAGQVYTLFNYGAGAVTNPGNLSVGWRGTVSDDFLNQRYVFTAGSSGTRTWIGGSGTWSQGVAGGFTEGDQTFYGGDDVIFNDAGAAATITLSGRLAPGSVTVNNAANAFTFAGTDGASDLTGAGELVKQGSGTLVINSAHTFTGGTSIEGGTLELSGATANLGTGTVTLSAGATLALNRSAAFTFSNPLAGQGRVSKVGAGRYTISGSNASAAIEWYFGILDPIASGLGFANAVALGGNGSSFTVAAGATGSAFFAGTGNTTPASISIGDGGTFTWNGSTGNTTILTGVISGSGTFSKTSGETLRLTGVHTHTGPLAIGGGGILEIAQDGQMGQGAYAGAVAITGGRLFVNSTANQAISGVISGAGRLDKSSTGTLVLSGENSYSGGTEHLGGQLEVAALSGIGSGYLAVKNGASFVYSGSGAETTTRNLFLDLGASVIDVTQASGVLTWNDAAAKNGDFTKLGAGTLDLGGAFSGAANLSVDGGLLRLRGANTFTGDITVVSGQLEIAGNGSLGSGSYAGGIALSGGSLSWASSATQTLSGAMSGGNLAVSAGELTLSGPSTRTGDTSVAGGVLVISNPDALTAGSVLIGSSGTLRLAFTPTEAASFDRSLLGTGILEIAIGGAQSVSLGSAGGFTGSVRLTSGLFDRGSWVGELLYAGGNVVGGFSGYDGDVTVESGSTYAVAALGMPSGLGLVTGGVIDFASVTGSPLVSTLRYAGGSLANAAAYTGTIDVQVTGLTLAANAFGSGTVRLGNGLSATLGAGFGNDIRLDGTASLTNDLATYAGTVILGNLAAYNLGLDPDFTRTASFRLTAGSRLRGQGAIGDLAVESGGILAPGNSPGTLTTIGNTTLFGGGRFEFEVLSTLGVLGDSVAGTDYDIMVVTGELDLSGLSSSSRFILDLISLTDEDTVGILADFDRTLSYQFTLIEYGTLDLGANTPLGTDLSSLFAINTSAFLDKDGFEVASGWSVINDNDTSTIILTYSTAIPEPSTYGLFLGALALAGAAIRRRRRDEEMKG
jgi:autotransporter-associated beta strand protein